MAIVRTPLLSFSASGKIAKSIVFSRWKGLNTARQYVVPANPNTAAQQVQRGLFATLAAVWTGILSAADKAKWAVYSTVLAEPKTAYNLAMQAGLEASKLATINQVYAAAFTVTDNAGDIDASVNLYDISDGAANQTASAVVLHYGQNPDQLYSDAVMTANGAAEYAGAAIVTTPGTWYAQVFLEDAASGTAIPITGIAEVSLT